MVAPVLQIPGIPGGPEVLIVLLIVVLLFGANKIPKLARSSGQAIGEFQKGREEIEQELSDVKDEATPESMESSTDETTTDAASSETPTGSATSETSSSSTTDSETSNN